MLLPCVYGELNAAGLISRDTVGEHAWVIPYLPLFNSDILTRLVEKHRTTYLYTDTNEILLQSMAVLILAHHSNPTMFTENRAIFELVANTWLDALLTFNCRLRPDIAATPDSNQYYAAGHGLGYFFMCAQQYHSISFAMSNQFRTMTQDRTVLQKWDNKVTAFAEITAILPNVIANFNKIPTPAFFHAVRHLQYMNDHHAEFQPIAVAVDVVFAEPQAHDNHSEATVVAIPVENVVEEGKESEEDVPATIGIDEEQARRQELGARMLFRGIGRIANPTATVPEDPEIDNAVQALRDQGCRIC